jgi:hypothetical protein
MVQPALVLMLVRGLDGNAAADNVITKLLELCRMLANGLFNSRRRLEIVEFNLQRDMHRVLLCGEYSPEKPAVFTIGEIHYYPASVARFVANSGDSLLVLPDPRPEDKNQYVDYPWNSQGYRDP